MKTLIYILITIAAGLIIYNFSFLDFSNLSSGESTAALIGVLASSCVVLLMVILLMSRAIAKKVGK